MYDRYPDDLSPKDMQQMRSHHMDELHGLYQEHLANGLTHQEARKQAIKTASHRFFVNVPEVQKDLPSTLIGKAWNHWHCDLCDDFASGINEDVPTNSMAGGAIANRPMGLGGVRTHMLRRELLTTVLGAVRARRRTRKKR